MHQSFYSSNLRSVKQEGVDMVMKIFMHSQTDEISQPFQPKEALSEKSEKSEDIVCEEILLNSFSNGDNSSI